MINFYLSLEVRTNNDVKITKRISHYEELLKRVINIISSTLRKIENSNNVDRDNLDFCIRQFDQIVRHLQHIVNVDSPIVDELLLYYSVLKQSVKR